MRVIIPATRLHERDTSQGVKSAKSGFELITGPHVYEMLSQPGFQKSWDELFALCSWASVFQRWQFIDAWYRAYREQHLPILIWAREDNQLTGVLPMVLLQGNERIGQEPRKKGRITCAGHYDAVYQCWLSAPSDENGFIKLALAELMKQFPGHAILFRFLPPGTPLNWMDDEKAWKRCMVVQTYVRPLIHLKDPGMEKLFRGKHFRYKLNRLRKTGDVHFECIRDEKLFETTLNELADIYDFRQGAMFNKNHFKEDPHKKEFLLTLFRLQLLHVTVLKVNENIIAAVIAIAEKDCIYLAGINCHSPFNARLYSPGLMHFILLAKLLKEEGITWFDLTPGYDAYKEELANRHDEVIELLISNNRRLQIKKKIRKWIHTRLIRAGIRPMTVELKLKKYLYLVQHQNKLSVLKGLRKYLQKKRKQKLYIVQTNPVNPSVNMIMHKDQLHDLLQYDSKGRGVSRWEFLSDAMRRFENGQHCFTWMGEDRLLCCAWINERIERPLAKGAILLESLYCHAAGKEGLPFFLNGVALNVAGNEEKSIVYFLSDDKLFGEIIRTAGFSV